MHNRSRPGNLQALFLSCAAAWLASRPRRPRHTLLWSAVCFAADLIAIPTILRAKPAITDAEFAELRPEEMPAADRAALSLPAEDRARLQKRSDSLLRAFVALPALLLLVKDRRKNAGDWIPDYVWGHALTYTVYTFSPLGPAFTDKFRPIVYRPEVPFGERTNGNNRNSQYSGHTGNAAFAGVFFARQLAQRFDMPLSLSLAIAATPALLVGSLRIRAQKHFPSDVLVACVVGGIFGCVFSKRRHLNADLDGSSKRQS